MQTVSDFFLGIGFACVLGGIVHLLSPGGSTERLMRLLTTLFILVSILSPLHNISDHFPLEKTGRMQTDFAVETVLENARDAIEKTAHSVTEKHGFPNAEIEVKTENKNGEVHARIFRIRGVSREKAQEITDEIFELTGERPVLENTADTSDRG